MSEIQRKDVLAASSGEPKAWLVDCPVGHEFDELVFADQDEAEQKAADFNDDYPEGENPHKAQPLYLRAALSAARASDAETIKNQGLYIATLRGLLTRAVNAMGMHGPCTNHSCRECSATFTDIRAALRKDPNILSPKEPHQ